jgi:S1 RNA binding domain protein
MTFEVGTIVEGKVTGITNFGAFVELPDGKTGLCHISEIADDYVKDVKDYLKDSQSVKVKIISIDEKGKISLSIRQADPSKSSESKPSESKPKAPSDKPFVKKKSFESGGDKPPYKPRTSSSSSSGGYSKDRSYSKDRGGSSRGNSGRDFRSAPKLNFEDMLTGYLKDSDDKQRSMKKSSKSTRKGNSHGSNS